MFETPFGSLGEYESSIQGCFVHIPLFSKDLLLTFLCLVNRHIYTNEGPRALYKGLGPNLVGVIPAR